MQDVFLIQLGAKTAYVGRAADSRTSRCDSGSTCRFVARCRSVVSLRNRGTKNIASIARRKDLIQGNWWALFRSVGICAGGTGLCLRGSDDPTQPTCGKPFQHICARNVKMGVAWFWSHTQRVTYINCQKQETIFSSSRMER
jgi:hypothetical protein